MNTFQHMRKKLSIIFTLSMFSSSIFAGNSRFVRHHNYRRGHDFYFYLGNYPYRSNGEYFVNCLDDYQRSIWSTYTNYRSEATRLVNECCRYYAADSGEVENYYGILTQVLNCRE